MGRQGGNRLGSVLVLSALTAVGLGVVLYFASTSVAWFATSPTQDSHFGALNHCLMQHVPSNRAGFAVSKDATRAATFNDRGLAVCGSDGTGRFVALPGISRLSWDHGGTLWIAASTRDAAGGSGLWRLRGEGAPEQIGALSTVALAGHTAGVAALESSGKLVSFGEDGQGLGFFELPARADAHAELVADSEGELLAVVMHSGLWILRARDLSPVRAESPCDAEFLWWLPQPGSALVSCGPNGSWTLSYQALTGARETVPQRERFRSTLVSRSGLYARACDGLPCTAPAPADL
ncbi:MAG: hypothetical protein WBV82_02850 [Myxococcaceae bacterium]